MKERSACIDCPKIVCVDIGEGKRIMATTTDLENYIVLDQEVEDCTIKKLKEEIETIKEEILEEKWWGEC